MNTRILGTIIAFTAITIVLSQIRIPLPFPPPGFTYQVYQIPIVVTVLFVGMKYGIVVGFLNMLVQMLFPSNPMGIVGPTYGFLITISLILGVYVSTKYFSTIATDEKIEQKKILTSTIVVTTIRTLFMLPLDFILFGALLSIALGFSSSEAYAYAFGIMPGIILFNIIVPLYVIPTSYILAHRISKNFKQSMYNE